LFSIGSCFATEISVKLADSQFQTLNNPFGTLFNPWAVKNSIQEIFENKIYTEEDLDFHQGEYLSFNHHTSFNSENQEDTLRKNKPSARISKTKQLGDYHLWNGFRL